MKAIRWSALLLAALCGTSAAARPAEIWLQASLHVDENGQVTHLDWDERSPVHDLVAERISPVVTRWTFVPATVNGRSVPTQTGLAVQVEVGAGDGGALSLRFKRAVTGPMAVNPTPPDYPSSAMRRGDSGTVLVDVSVAGDGSPVVHDLRFEASGHVSSTSRKDFIANSEAAVKSWSFRPEVVDGHSASTVVRIPIRFCGASGCIEPRKKATAASDGRPADLYIADISAISLKTEIAGAGI